MFSKMSFLRLPLSAALFASVSAGMAPNALTGAAQAAEAKPTMETAVVAGGALRIEVKSSCDRQGNTIFKVKNAGSAWPKTSTFAIYRLGAGEGQMISKRRMRLAEGQHASFRIKAKRNLTGKLAISVLPGWYERKAKYDATASCR